MQYLELMTSAGGGSEAAGLGFRQGLDDNLTKLYERLNNNSGSDNLKSIAGKASLYLNRSDSKSLQILKARGYPGSNVTVKYQYTATRNGPKEEVFAQLALERIHPDAMAMFFNGCAGDQNPLPRRSGRQRRGIIQQPGLKGMPGTGSINSE